MIDIKPPEEDKTELYKPTDVNGVERMPDENSWDEFWKRTKDAIDEGKAYVPINDSTAEVATELHEINKTLKSILEEMRKRKV